MKGYFDETMLIFSRNVRLKGSVQYFFSSSSFIYHLNGPVGKDFAKKKQKLTIDKFLKLGYPEQCHNHWFSFGPFWLDHFLDVLFHFQKRSGHPPFKKVEGVFQFEKNNIVIHISFSWINIRLHTLLGCLELL